MRAFLIAVAASIVIAIVAAIALNSLQEDATVAFSTSAVRI